MSIFTVENWAAICKQFENLSEEKRKLLEKERKNILRQLGMPDTSLIQINHSGVDKGQY